MRTAVLVPSRGRPGNIEDLIEAWAATSAGFAELFIAVDLDDSTLKFYEAITLPPWATLVCGPRLRLGGTLNHYGPVLAKTHDVIGFMGDDHRPRTPNWDVAVAFACAGGGIAYGDDLFQRENLPTAVFLDAAIVRATGHLVLPGQIHLWMDNYWKRLGEELGTLRYLPNVVIEHMHPAAGKADLDAGYAEANADAVWDNDKRIFDEWVQAGMSTEVALIRAALAERDG
jgi:hypothetical protein